jgi:hypothetical protein
MFHPIVGAKVPSRVGAGVAGMLGGGACAALGAFRARAFLGRQVGALASPWVQVLLSLTFVVEPAVDPGRR